MSLKEKINNFFDSLGINVEDDFDVTFEDHMPGNKKYYRLHYINYHNINRDPNRRGLIDWPYKPFGLPDGMSREDGFKVLSYLTDFIEKRDDVYEASWKSVGTLDGVISLERFGFKRLDFSPKVEDVIDLFTIDGRIRRFKDSKYYDMYFNWYISNVSKNEVEEIYSKCGLVFEDIVWLDKYNNVESQKNYEKANCDDSEIQESKQLVLRRKK